MAEKRVRRQPSKTIVLEFEDGDYAGARIVCASELTIGAYQALTRPDGETDDVRMMAMLDRFADEIVLDWNLDDEDGNPLPPNKEGFKGITMSFAGDIFQRWNETLTGVSDPLAEPSDDGPQWEGPSIPMVPLSPNPPSSPTPNSSSELPSDLESLQAVY